jgi:adenylate kinase family enzyme
MQRIAIIGCCSAGKSTLAKVLSSKLGLPVIHLDSYYWQPQWVETATEKWIITHQSLITSDRWIIDGNYIGTEEKEV